MAVTPEYLINPSPLIESAPLVKESVALAGTLTGMAIYAFLRDVFENIEWYKETIENIPVYYDFRQL